MKTKKLILMQLSLFAWTTLFSAQTKQEQADSIVSERLNGETHPYIVYAKEDVQKDMIIASVAGERLKMNYSCWVYYIHYADSGQGRYLIVKESNGNLLEVNAKSGAEPDDLAKWRIVQIEIPATKYAWKTLITGCKPNPTDYCDNSLVVVNDNEKWEYCFWGIPFTCMEEPFPDIDFSKHTLLLASGYSTAVLEKDFVFLKKTMNEYILRVKIRSGVTLEVSSWSFCILVPKLDNDATVTLEVQKVFY